MQQRLTEFPVICKTASGCVDRLPLCLAGPSHLGKSLTGEFGEQLLPKSNVSRKIYCRTQGPLDRTSTSADPCAGSWAGNPETLVSTFSICIHASLVRSSFTFVACTFLICIPISDGIIPIDVHGASLLANILYAHHHNYIHTLLCVFEYYTSYSLEAAQKNDVRSEVQVTITRRYMIR